MHQGHSDRRLALLLLEIEEVHRRTRAVDTAFKADTGISADYDSIENMVSMDQRNKIVLDQCHQKSRP